MFWKKKKKSNRRFRRRHVLDVKLSSQQRRQSLMRRVLFGVTICLSVVTGLLAVWRGGEWLLRRFVYENAAFAIHTLDVRSDGVIAPDQVRHWAGVKLQDNLLALDITRVKRDLELVPMIQSVAVERALPHTLRIRVSEREPMAKCVFPSAGYNSEPRVFLLDSQAVVMLPVPAYQRSVPAITNAHLPQLLGIPAKDLRPGKQTQLPQVVAALQWLDAFDRSPMADLVVVQEIDVTAPNFLLVTTLEHSAVTFGVNDPDEQIARWHLVHEHARRAFKAVASLDLSVLNNVPVTWMEASLAPPPFVKPSKVTRAKRKHV